MGIRDRIRDAQAKAKADREAAEATRAENARVAAEQQAAATEAHAKARTREILGAELADMEVTTPDEAKAAIKLARLRKTEISAEKRDLAAELADVREEWRNRQAGRITTTGFGRGTSGRMVRGAIQANRRSERMSHAEVVNDFSDRKQELDQALAFLDRVIVGLQRDWVATTTPRPTRDAEYPTATAPTTDPTVVLAQLATLRDQGLITAEDYDAKKTELLNRM